MPPDAVIEFDPDGGVATLCVTRLAPRYRIPAGRCSDSRAPLANICKVTAAFYQPDGNTFIPTEWTRGPWDPAAQHAGPPSALIGRCVEQIEPDTGWLVSRFSVDILKPIPLVPLTVESQIKRRGRSTQLIDVVLRSRDAELARASVWRIKSGRSDTIAAPLPHPRPGDVATTPFVHPGWDPSYFTSLEWRYVQGSIFERGPGVVWTRSRCAVVSGEKLTPLQRVLITADSGNGVSSVTPLETSLFINVELTVHLIGELRGEWVCLDAQTTVGVAGIGVARSTLWDEHGCVGFGAQSLLMATR